MNKQLALAGLAAGLALTGCDSSGVKPKTETQISATAQKTLNEQDLLTQLTPEGKKAYLALDPEGKKLALQLANQTCAGKNSCAGLNSCASDKNACAGHGSCQGTSKGAFTDKNEAVKVAAMKMESKRQELTK
jgi:hypothetical protein